VLSAVVYSNGDVSVCENHKPLGNIRDEPFNKIWRSQEAQKLRSSIRAEECYCTNEIFLWPSITYQPLQLSRALIGAKVWRKPEALAAEEHADWTKPSVNIPLPVVQLTREANKLSPDRFSKNRARI
jgi:hypothetical protein